MIRDTSVADGLCTTQRTVSPRESVRTNRAISARCLLDNSALYGANVESARGEGVVVAITVAVGPVIKTVGDTGEIVLVVAGAGPEPPPPPVATVAVVVVTGTVVVVVVVVVVVGVAVADVVMPMCTALSAATRNSYVVSEVSEFTVALVVSLTPSFTVIHVGEAISRYSTT